MKDFWVSNLVESRASTAREELVSDQEVRKHERRFRSKPSILKTETSIKDKTSIHWKIEVSNLVESEGFEPSSKRRITKLSTCLVYD